MFLLCFCLCLLIVGDPFLVHPDNQPKIGDVEIRQFVFKKQVMFTINKQGIVVSITIDPEAIARLIEGINRIRIQILIETEV